MKLKLARRPQCVHKTEKEAEKGNGRCSRCAMPCAPFNHIRFWSPFMHNVSRFHPVKVTPGNSELLEAFIKTPESSVQNTQAA